MSTSHIAGLSPSVLMGIKNLLVRARSVVEGALVGEHVSPFRGGSIEFAQHRSYSPGDELRYIDWRLFARTDHYHVKQFEVTTNLRAYILLDSSGSMSYPEGQGVAKHDYAATLVAALSYILIQQSDAVSVTTHRDDDVIFLPPRSQVAYLQQICQIIENTKPAGDHDILQLLKFAQDRIVQRSLVVLFSDFLVDLDQLMAKIRILQSRGHDLMIYQILHRDELEFPFSRFYRFESMEDPRFMVADSKQIRAQYMEALQEHQDQLRAAMRKIGVDFQTVHTEESPSRVIANCLNGPMRAKKLRKLY
ncbi:DUF58 domain-containing protein [Sulfidibacter corallicola]|uniref:DUF58 domain-containing protein n=1 Tax=Sulfidibacter corallicola TaxID=2818388 RepID=A0A8A4TDU2_SULCO|nr:DUF58 domain-containing protein [Sulfidibacter corallicola]QTD47730.1 DUF58 domain-containing protein [Sulfidibacter corallicola]